MSKTKEIRRLRVRENELMSRVARLKKENQTLLEGKRQVICPYCDLPQPRHVYIPKYNKGSLVCNHCEETFIAFEHSIKIYEVWGVGGKVV